MRRQAQSIIGVGWRSAGSAIGRLPALVWLWCGLNLLWSFGGGWTLTVRRTYTPLRSFDKASLDSYWEAHRFVASHGGDLVVSWPLFPGDAGLAVDGVSLSADWTPRRNPWATTPLGVASASGDWPARAAAGHGFSWHGFLVVHHPVLYYRNYRGVAVPWWMLTAATFPLAAGLALRRRVRSARSSGGLCAVCGYDLRATPGRCPECGTHTRRGQAAA